MTKLRVMSENEGYVRFVIKNEMLRSSGANIDMDIAETITERIIKEILKYIEITENYEFKMIKQYVNSNKILSLWLLPSQEIVIILINGIKVIVEIMAFGKM